MCMCIYMYMSTTEEGKEIQEDGKDHKEEKKEEKEPAKEVKEEDAKQSKEVKEDPKKEEKAKEEKAEGEKEESANSQEAEDGAEHVTTLQEQFKAFSKFGDTKSDGKHITLSQSDKWMKQAKVIDGKKITTTDTAIQFKKFKQKKINFEDFEKYLDGLTKAKKVDLEAIKEKLSKSGPPGVSGTTNVVKTTALNRLTDTKKYTGSHKLRFDEAGKGKGTEGRKDVPDGSGYVTGYKNKSTYDKSH